MRLLATDPGFNLQQTLAFDLSSAKAKNPNAEEQQRFLKELNEGIAALSGVAAVGAVTNLPLSRVENANPVRRSDQPPREPYIVSVTKRRLMVALSFE
jgi:hypothetical protein